MDDTEVQVNRWEGYKFESYESAIRHPEARISQMDDSRELGHRFRLEIYDGDKLIDDYIMVGASMSLIGGDPQVTGFAEDRKPEVYHTGIFRPEMWTVYPKGTLQKREDEQ